MGKRVLFVDDDKEWRAVAAAWLTKEGYEVLTAKDATEALARTEGMALGAVILDLNLAGENGLMLMRFLKHNHPAVPIILYTGLEHDQEQVATMLKEGAYCYLRKGDIAELLKTVEKALTPDSAP